MTLIRAATPADLPAVSRLMGDTWRAAYSGFIPMETINRLTGEWHTVERLKRQLAKPGLLFLVAEDRDGIAGHAAAAIEEGDEVFLRRLYVHPRTQGAGLGRRLFDAVEAAFPSGAPMRLEVFAANARALAFYRRLGFEVTPETADGTNAWEGLVEYEMVRPRNAYSAAT
jgi:ribosomal protein S18 acetylase RimI-like enzyme